MRTLLADLRFAFRMLGKRPGFTAVAVVALALGLGANTAVFSVIRGVVLRPLPYHEPDRLVAIWESNLKANVNQEPTSPPNLRDWSEKSRSFTGMAGYILGWTPLTDSGEAEMLNADYVTANYFSVLGVNPALGRLISSGDEAGNVVVLSSELWDRRFGRDPHVIGRQLRLTGALRTVIGVMPPHFRDADFIFRSPADAWMPLDPSMFGPGRRSDFLRVIARMRPEVTLRQARAEMTGIGARLKAEYPADNSPWTIEVHSLSTAISGYASPALWLLLASAAALLTISCANVATLSLARSNERRREFAIRAALGGNAANLFRQLITESMLLGLIGGTAGFLLGHWTVPVLMTIGGAYIPRAQEVRFDFAVMLFAGVISSLTAVLFGVLPAREAARADLTVALNSASRAATPGRRSVREALVMAQVALSLILLIVTGLLLRSFWQVRSVDLGFAPTRLLTAGVRLSDDPARAASLLDDLLQAIGRMPGVTSAAACAGAPMTAAGHNAFMIEGQSTTPADLSQDAILDPVTPAYFRTMGIALRQGRYLTPDDLAQSPHVVINESLARRHFPNDDPLGRRLSFDQGKTFWPIVGVVADVHQTSATATPKAQVYIAYRQHPVTRTVLAVRTSLDPRSLISPIRAVLHALDPNVPLYDVRTQEELIENDIGPRRFAMTLVGLFAGLAFLVASIGIYGVISYTVAQSTKELGIRMALGAVRSDVLGMVLRRGLRLVAIGIGVGTLTALAATRLMASFLFNVSASDPVTFLSVAGIFIIVALAACLIPARRATNVDPMEALRYE